MCQELIGIGLRNVHLEDVVARSPNIGFLEVHSENFLSLGGLDFDILLQIRERYPLSLHGIAMSLGSITGVDKNHICAIKDLIEIIDPFMVSDHLSWSAVDEKFLPDLIPVPFNDEALSLFSQNIQIAQDILKRQIFVENPSTYFEYTNSTYHEAEFLNILAEKTGAGVLLDLNNLYVSGLNNNWSPKEYIDIINPSIIKEVHVAGHAVKTLPNNNKLYVDSHDSSVSNEVWDLYDMVLDKIGSVHTLIEWDTNIPTLGTLLLEAEKIKLHLNQK